MVDSSDIVLTYSNGALRFNLVERDWYELVVVQSGQADLTLGSQRLSYLVQHLLQFLLQPSPDIHWIMSLSERHYSAYGQLAPAGGVTIYIQDELARPMGQVRATEQERQSWVMILHPFQGP